MTTKEELEFLVNKEVKVYHYVFDSNDLYDYVGTIKEVYDGEVVFVDKEGMELRLFTDELGVSEGEYSMAYKITKVDESFTYLENSAVSSQLINGGLKRKIAQGVRIYDPDKKSNPFKHLNSATGGV